MVTEFKTATFPDPVDSTFFFLAWMMAYVVTQVQAPPLYLGKGWVELQAMEAKVSISFPQSHEDVVVLYLRTFPSVQTGTVLLSWPQTQTDPDFFGTVPLEQERAPRTSESEILPSSMQAQAVAVTLHVKI